MLLRFSLYGFLKNQRYFEPFLVLAFLARGLSYTEIGLLIGFREICINVMEIPSGAVADVSGRRRCMMISFGAYIASYVILAYAGTLWPLLGAMLLFAAGDAFRTGTHKAMIFDWLAREGRSGEKTRVYGFTRSWSKIGSAVSVIVATVLVFTVEVENYRWVFLLSIVPYAANLVNFLLYPRRLDGESSAGFSMRRIAATTWAGLRRSMRHRPLRRVLGESMAYEGVYKSTKDYIQPLLKAAALGLPVLLWMDGRERTAVVVGGVYFVLFVASSAASRHSYLVSEKARSDVRGALWLWAATFAGFGVMAVGLATGLPGVAVAAFVALALLQNFWRPLIVGRVADQTDDKEAATVLSVESQAKSLFAAVVAPLLGLAVDLSAGYVGPERKFLPVAALGLLVTGYMLLRGRRAVRQEEAAARAEPQDGARRAPSKRRLMNKRRPNRE